MLLCFMFTITSTIVIKPQISYSFFCLSAVKCNDDLTVLEILAALGCGFDCASKNEISKVLSLGVSPDRIIYANPTKPLSQIQYASSVGVDTMTFDNVNELYKIHKAFPQAR